MAVLLVLHLAAASDVRLVSDGTGEAPVTWLRDGLAFATTRDGEPATVWVEAGRHEVWAQGPARGGWTVLARPEPATDEVAYVPAWTAVARPVPEAGVPVLQTMAALALAAALAFLRARPLRTKSP